MKLTAALLLLAAALPAQAPLVATHYFYWYRWPDEHFAAGRPGHEGHLHRLPAPEKVSYLDASWHARQFRDMAECGIDIALPVYWGAPGAYERPNLRFARAGLAPMVQALEQLEAEPAPTVRLGLFYDTSTLANAVRGAEPREGKTDLTEEAGRTLFCRTVTDYFAVIPPRFWARVRGGALVVLYVSGFAARWDAGLGNALRQAFTARFPGERVFLVADASWGDIGQDRQTSWGAALVGPRLFPGVAQIGPGYDDSPVPGRRTPRRDREGGAFYRWSWRRAVLTEPELVLIETWNEMHEGTEICETVETGRRYLELTREWIGRLRRGEPGEPIALAARRPQPRADRSWGEEAAGAAELSADYTGEGPARQGLREIPWEDGPLAVRGRRLVPTPGTGGHGYLYFQIADAWKFDTDTALQVVVELDATAHAGLALQYDSNDESAILEGSYTRAPVVGAAPAGSGGWQITFTLPRARLANRQNGGADFRLVLPARSVAVRRVLVREEKP